MQRFILRAVIGFFAFITTQFAFSDATQANNNFEKYQAMVQPIVAQMTLNEKLGQMVLVKYTFLQQDNKINFDLINKYHLGGILAAGGEVPNGNGGVLAGADDPKDYLGATAKNWRYLNNQTDAHPVILKNGDKIKLLLGVDAVHGAHFVLGAITLPQNINLSMTHNPTLLKSLGEITAQDLKSVGFNWAYAPTVAVSHNPQWGRTYETLGSVPALTGRYTSALVQGMQQQDSNTGQITGILATVKHYLGDGATWNGVDEGNDHINDFNRFININSTGYQAAINNNAGSIMVSYSGINDQPMSTNKLFLTDLLKQGELNGKPFTGFLVSDYGAIDKVANQGLPTTHTKMPYPEALTEAINSGIDMIMLSSTAADEKNLPHFLTIFKQQVTSGAIPMQRINDAVTRILAVKYAMGLIKDNNSPSYSSTTTTAQYYSHTQKVNLTTNAAEQSLVLLKNNQQLLPVNKNKIKYVILVGESLVSVRQDDGSHINTLFTNYNNIGIQNGGWTVSWQGIEGNDFWQGNYKQSSAASSVQDGLKQALPNSKFFYANYTDTQSATAIKQARKRFIQQLKKSANDMNSQNTIVIGVLAERPYAEFMGDINSPYCTNSTDASDGCLYNLHLNPYLPDQQMKTLAIDYSHFDKKIIHMLKKKNIPLVSVLFSGRPMIIDQKHGPLTSSNAFVAAWLPGNTGGQAIANAIVGQYLFCHGQHQPNNQLCLVGSPNTLSVNWVRNMQQLVDYPVYNSGKGFVAFPNPLFPINYGLATTKR